MSDSILRDLSMEFSIEIIRICENIKGHYSLVNQLERSATSIGANIYEANYAQSKADFISKLQISLKECHETGYWLELFEKSGIIDSTTAEGLNGKCSNIRRKLIASLKTVKTSNSPSLA